MRAVQTKLAEDIQELLLQSSALVDKYENKDLSFVASFKAWLIDGEALLKEHNKPHVSKLAGIRSVIIAAERGVYAKNINITSTKSRRKTSSAIAAISLNDAQHILQEVLDPILRNIEKSKTLITQMLSVAAQKNLIEQHWLTDDTLSNRLQNLWKVFSADSELTAGAKHVLTLISYVDALRLMEEVLDEWADNTVCQ